MTCGSILWLKISPQSRWITCRKEWRNQQIHRAAWETGREEEGIVSLSVSSVSLGKLLPLPPSPEDCTHPQSRLAASGGWTVLVSQPLCACLFWRGVSDGVCVVCVPFVDSLVSPPFPPSCPPYSPLNCRPHSSKKITKGKDLKEQ